MPPSPLLCLAAVASLERELGRFGLGSVGLSAGLAAENLLFR